MTTFSDNSSIDHQIENVYKQAADLFDPNTVLDINKDEYARGVVELVMNLLGMDSDDKEDVATTIGMYTQPNVEHLLRRKRLNAIIDRHWPNGTLDEFYSESSDHAVVMDKQSGDLWQVFPDGTIKVYRA